MYLKKLKKPLIILISSLVAIVLAYVIYVFATYHRIDDMKPLEICQEASLTEVQTNTTYTVLTQNLGFGAYTDDFTFFMDGGKSSWAESEESVVECISKSAEYIASQNPDFIFLQEVDIDSTRSYHINQLDLLRTYFDGYQEVFAVNYHSAFLMYPFHQPHGASNAGLATYSKPQMTSALRRQLEISTSFSKFLDLDRCYSVSRIPVSNGKELVLYNTHLSAYGGSDEIRTSQMTMLLQDMKKEYDAGNYVLCGGDYNHDFTGNSTQMLNDMDDNDFGWAQPFPAELLPEGITRCIDYSNGETIATARNCDVPYSPDCFTVILDGFLVSDNIKVTHLENQDLGFLYSDHNPVVMQFELVE